MIFFEKGYESSVNRWLFGLCAVLCVLLLECLNAMRGGFSLYAPSVPLFLFPALPGVIAIYIASRLGFYRSPATARIYIFAGIIAVYCVPVLFYTLLTFGSAFKVSALLVLFCLAWAGVYLLEKKSGILGGVCQAGLYIGLFVVWCWSAPETKLAGTEDSLWVWAGHFTVLTALLAMGYRGVAVTGVLARWVAAAALAGLIAAAVAGAACFSRGESSQSAASYNRVAPQGRTTGAKNIVLVVLDTLRRDHLSIYGYERNTSPFIEQWSEECQVYTNAVSVSPWTLPAHASLFTGLLPRLHGAHIFLPRSLEGIPMVHAYPLAPSFTTLAEIFRDRGYDTGAVVANQCYVSNRYGLDQGFEYFDHGSSRDIIIARSDFMEFLACRVFDMRNPESPYIFADEVTRLALAWTQQRKEKPFFLFLNYMETHCPYVPPKPFREAFEGRKRGIYFRSNQYTDLQERLLAGGGMTPAEKSHLVSQYDASILYFDEWFRRLIQGLGQQGFLDNTYIYLLGDHGESFGEHNYFMHGNDVYESELIIPLLIRHPGGTRTGRFDDPVLIVDLFPTMLMNAGVELSAKDKDMDGVPIASACPEGASLSRRRPGPSAELYYAMWTWLFSPYGDRFKRIRRVVYDNEFKVIVSTDGNNETYNLSRDPLELDNLSSERSDLVKSADRVVNDYLDSTVPPPPTEWPDIDQESIELMRSLGYLR